MGRILIDMQKGQTVRVIPPDQDDLWRNVRDRCRVGRDEVRAALDGRAVAKGR